MGQFSFIHSPIEVAQRYWKAILKAEDLAIDATVGNGYDTLFLAQICYVIAIDIQELAIQNSKELLVKSPYNHRVKFHLGSHAQFPREILKESVKLIVYNLGYLPKGNKQLTTKCSSTLKSLAEALELLKPGGSLSITCYPGHAEGEKEETAILDFAAKLPAEKWISCHHRTLNRKLAPSLILIEKSP